MEFLDPRLAVLSLGVAAVASERVRRVIGRGIGYAAAGTVIVAGPVVDAGRDIVAEARDVARHNGSAPSTPARKKSATTA